MNFYHEDDIPEDLRRFFRPPPQIGLEATPDAYIARMVKVFREVRRVLRDDGTLWLNMGDSYATAGGDDRTGSSDGATGRGERPDERRRCGIRPKSLLGIPWRLALALQADGWILRQDIVWHKPSPMPESVRDRCTKAHEYIFLLTKRPSYYFNPDAIAEPLAESSVDRLSQDVDAQRGSDRVPGKTNGTMKAVGRMPPIGGIKHAANGFHGGEHTTYSGNRPEWTRASRNRRSVWRIAPAGFKEAHFATFPPELPRLCISAGTSEHGCCAACGAPWRRKVEKRLVKRPRPNDLVKRTGEAGTGNSCANTVAGVSRETVGWEPTCDGRACRAMIDAGKPPDVVPCTVLDPFSGAGTTVMVADRLGRNGIGIELNPDYAAMARRRIRDDIQRRGTVFPSDELARPRNVLEETT
jgi:DNA modification methylase